MLFPTHLLAAWLLGRATRLPAAWLVVGAAAPDLIDKPLAAAGVTTLYHSAGHSALLAVVALPLAAAGPRGLAAAAGWASHLALDALHVVLNGRPWDALFLAWPVVRPPDPLALPPVAFLRYYRWSPAFVLELLLWAGVALLVARRLARGRPGRG